MVAARLKFFVVCAGVIVIVAHGFRPQAHVSTHCTDTPKKFIFVRHGESVNNIMSNEGYKGLPRYLKEPNKEPQDTVLSTRGTEEAVTLAKGLFGENRVEDKYQLFNEYKAVYVSPLRRTQGTAFELFGMVAAKRGIPFVSAPWAHEQRKSISDVGSTKSKLVNYAHYYVNELKIDNRSKPVQSLVESLDQLAEDWSTNTDQPDGEDQLSYYPAGGFFSQETAAHVCNRMERLQKELCESTHDAAFVVCHSAVIRHMFALNSKPANLAMIGAELTDKGWQKVKLMNETYAELPGYETEKKAVGQCAYQKNN